ncbi:hypothetical protein PO909_003419, partial [Leuciscus waleckii]
NTPGLKTHFHIRQDLRRKRSFPLHSFVILDRDPQKEQPCPLEQPSLQKTLMQTLSMTMRLCGLEAWCLQGSLWCCLSSS